MTAQSTVPAPRRVARLVAALALSAGVTAAATVVAPSAAHAATCKPTNLDGTWYSTDHDAHITRIHVENLSCTTGESGFAIQTWAHPWLGLHQGEDDWGVTRDVTSSAYGFTTATYVVDGAWTTYLSMIPDYDGETLYTSQRDDYVQPGTEDYVWPDQTFVH